MKRKIWVLVLLAGLCVLFTGIGVFSTWSGMSIGLMGIAEQVSIMNVRFVEDASAGDMVKVTVRNKVPLQRLFMKDMLMESKLQTLIPSKDSLF